MTTKAQIAEQEAAREQLRDLIKPGDTLRTILRHVAPSGMSRWISVVITDKDGPWDVTYLVAKALGEKIGTSKHDGIRVQGCGMDMGFHLVYGLSRALYPEYTCTGERCPSNSHVNTPRVPRDGTATHTDGYAISQRWL